MTAFRGLTWDHPRGRDALQAAAAEFSGRGPDTLHWEVHPLEGFESSPIEHLAESYDLLVLDHPHLGDALAADCLRPLDELFTPDELGAWADAAVGPSAASYRLDGSTWALPLDAATQVAARRVDLVPEAPTDWDAALRLAAGGLVAPSLAGPHAFLSLCSIAVSLGADPGSAPLEAVDAFLPRETGLAALEILARLAAHAPSGSAHLNPIGLLERMTAGDDLGYVPLVYGYVTYSAPDLSRRVTFGAPPAAAHIGSTIGGTGIAVSRRAEPTRDLLDHLRWLLSADAQSRFIPRHAGQPSARSAWLDPAVDAAAGGFYSGTLATIESSWVRPRFPGYIPFQAEGSAIVRDGILAGAPAGRTLDSLDAAYRRAADAAAPLASPERTPA
ncbi:carbohydrate ABC transporter substrate-binding protein [Planctomonas psychrotolerans]|uniref:carbohydrate ABC transporter substrate-binding protein n=1 Tax=Planctomonas psychrotolerans TaxID=2528712 RepID=UPI00123B8A6B|nr:carbohydrate ABC transporter substrate-binding protein [Planctomonas psychrotolerans]